MIKRTIQELKLRYSLQSFNDVYVEGESDKRFLDGVSRDIGVSDIVFYCIDSVEIDKAVFNEYQLVHHLNRDKVTALIAELGEIQNCPVGIIDRDFSDWRKDHIQGRNLVYTDFANCDMYSIDQCSVRDLFGFLKIKKSVSSVFQVLSQLFALRFVATSSDIGLKILDNWCKHVSINDGELTIDISKLIRLSNDRQKSLAPTLFIENKYEQVKERHPDLIKKGYFNGHDAFLLLSTIVSRGRKNCKMSEDDIRDWMQFARCTNKRMSPGFIKRIYGI